MASEWTLLYNGGDSLVRVAVGWSAQLLVADELQMSNFLALVAEKGV
jgi:hypothetical protein